MNRRRHAVPQSSALALPVVLLIAVLAPTAHAATVDRAGEALIFTGAGEVNDVRLYNEQLRSGAIELVVDDRGGTPVTLTDGARGAGCRQYVDEYDQDPTPDPQRVICPSPSAVRVDLNAGDDRVFITTSLRDDPAPVFPMQVDGGPGDDRLFGGPLNDELHGGDGNDALDGLEGDGRVFGEAGADELRNHDGDDLFDGGDGDDSLGKNESLYGYLKDGNDVLRGGAGADTMSYRRSVRVLVSLDDQPNDGKPAVSRDTEHEPKEAEADNVGSDVEIVNGTGNGDVIRGNGQANVLRGGGGDDKIFAGGGDDVLDGQEGADYLGGEDGDDLLVGGLGGDWMNGGSGADTVRSDVCEGSSVAGGGCFQGDLIELRDDSRDVALCTPSTRHRVAADTGDEVNGCAEVERGHLIPTFTRSQSNRRQLWTAGIQRWGLGIEMRCPAACKLAVELVISAKLAKQLGLSSRVVGERTVTPEAGKTYFVVRLTKSVVKRLLRPKRWTLTIRVTAVTGIWSDTYVVTQKRRVRRV